MNLSVSHIAWNSNETEEALAILKKYGVQYLEVAPTMLFDEIKHVKDQDITGLKGRYHKKGFSFVAMQSLLYRGPARSIFDTGEEVLLEYLSRIVRTANLLGIDNLVFGSPNNRIIKDYRANNASQALSFFKKLAHLAKENKVTICLEATPKEYGCDFITNTFDAIEFIKKIDHPNFKLNLDTGTIMMNNEDIEKLIQQAKDLIGHVHVSAPYVGEITGGVGVYTKVYESIRSLHYNGFVSLEMKRNITNSNLKALERNLKIFLKIFSPTN